MFIVGFTKIADNAATGGSNNQGLQFNSSDNTNATSNVGPGGMTPQGIESYQPIPKQPEGKPKDKKKGDTDKKKETFDIASFFMQKGASVRGNAGASAQKDVPGFTNNITQALKYDSSTVDASPEDMMSTLRDERARVKKYKKAEKK